MNLAQARVVLRPRSVPEIFDLALRFVVAGRGTFLRLWLLLLAPTLGLFAAAVTVGELREAHALWIVAGLLTPWLVGVFVVASARLLFEARPPLRSILGQFLRRFIPFTVASVIALALIGFGALFAIGAPILGALTLFYIEAALLEGQGPLAALGRAKRLLTHRFGVAFLIVLGLAAASAAIVGAAESLGHALVSFVLQLGEPFGDFEEEGISLYAMLGYFASLPFVGAVHFLSYIDLRTRQDGWDLQVRFMGLAAADAAEAGGAAIEEDER